MSLADELRKAADKNTAAIVWVRTELKRQQQANKPKH